MHNEAYPPTQAEAIEPGTDLAGVIQTLMELGYTQDQIDEVKRKMGYGEAMAFGTSSPEGRQMGRMYTAASPWEHAGAMAMRYAGDKRLREGDVAIQGQLDQKRKALKDLGTVLGRGTTP